VTIMQVEQDNHFTTHRLRVDGDEPFARSELSANRRPDIVLLPLRYPRHPAKQISLYWHPEAWTAGRIRGGAQSTAHDEPLVEDKARTSKLACRKSLDRSSFRVAGLRSGDGWRIRCSERTMPIPPWRLITAGPTHL